MKKFKCVLCGSEVKGITVHDFKMSKGRTGIDWQLCPNHAIKWILRELSDLDVKLIRTLAGGDTYHTHDDFYDTNGISLQPIGRRR